MRKNNLFSSGFLIPRIAFAFALFSAAGFLAFFSFAANPESGTLMEAGPSLTYTAGPFLISNPSAQVGLICNAQFPCDEYTLTVNITTAQFAADKNVKISVSWPNPAEDYDVYVLQGGMEVTSAASSGNPEVAVFPAVVGENIYTIRTVPFAVAGGSFTALIEFIDKPVPPTPGIAGIAPRYHVFAPPAGLGASAGEPSIGIGKAGMGGETEGRAMFIASLQTLRISFNDCASPAAGPGFPEMADKNMPLWEDKSATTTSITSLDPILFTDPQTGRTFVSQLLGKASSIAFTDNDGGDDNTPDAHYMQSQGSGINSGVDHQTVGGGPFAPPLTRDPNGLVYPNAVYYASQDLAIAQAAISLDGGQTFGASVPMYNLTQCAGIHGHLKVAPDGTAYVPNKACNGVQAAVVSENNGTTWEVRPVPGSTAASGIIDPAVGVGAQGRVFFGGVGGDRIPFVAVSDDKGRTWKNFQAIGADLGIKNATFSQMTAGDNDRAAFAFLGTTTGGNYQIPMNFDDDDDPTTPEVPNPNGFKGTWHMYVSTTYDAGVTWTTINVTPNDPVQQGSICNGGTVCTNTPNDRNLLDFNDIQIDKEGRVLVAFADGCITDACIQGLDENSDGFKDNDFTDRATIARQAGGRRLLAAFDPRNPLTGLPDPEPNPPASPLVASVVREGSSVRVDWEEPDNGGAPLTSYNIFRREASGSFGPLPLATVSADKTDFDDATALPNASYFYKVTANNFDAAIADTGEGTNCGEFAVGEPVGNICILPGLTKLTDAAGDSLLIPPQGTDLLSFQLAQPFAPDGDLKLVFTINTDPGMAVHQTGSAWYVAMRIVEDGGATTRFKGVHMTYKAAGAGQPVFESYTPSTNMAGGTDGRFVGGDVLPADPQSNYSTPFNKIVLVVKASDLGLTPGETITGFVSATTQTTDLADVGAGGTAIIDDMSGLAFTGDYTVNANAFCGPNAAPVAALTATPRSGQAPLQVTFDAIGSSDPDSGDTVVSYKFTFGDDTPPVTQMNDATIDHTYQDQGTYRATVQVTSGTGEREKVSENVADVLIDVTSLLQSVVSRKMHGSITPPFDIELPQQGQPGIECRSGGANGAYQMVFTFVDPVTAVAETEASAPNGNPSASGEPGPDSNQYTVNITGTPNGQYLTVTLNGVQTGGTTLNNVQSTMGVLLGDTSADRVVNSADITQTRRQSGQPASSNNFRTDLSSEDGVVNSADITAVRRASGTAIR